MDNIDSKDPAGVVRAVLHKMAVEKAFLLLPVYLQRARTQERIDARTEFHLDAVFEDRDAVDKKIQVIALKLFLCEDIVEDLKRRLGGAFYFDDRVAPVAHEVDLITETLKFLLKVGLHLVVSLLQYFLVLGVLQHIAHALALRDFESLLRILEDFGEVVGAPLRLLHIGPLFFKVEVQLFHHCGGFFHHPPEIFAEQGVEFFCADVVARAVGESALVVVSAS